MLTKCFIIIRKVILLFSCIIVFGCTGLPPAPEEPDYFQAVETFPEAKSALYLIKAYW